MFSVVLALCFLLGTIEIYDKIIYIYDNEHIRQWKQYDFGKLYGNGK